MDLASQPGSGNAIQAYGPAGFRISNTEYAHPVLVSETLVVAWNGEWTLDALEPILSVEPRIEVLIAGTGPALKPLSPALVGALARRGVAVDAMNTGAACRTLTVLLSEGRRAGAALLLP